MWFTTGVVLTLFATLLVFSEWRADAAPGDADTTFVPVAPCRLFDTRPGELPNGGKKSPLGAGESNVMLQKVTGSVGDCVGIPSDAKAVAMNVTIVGPTAQSNLRVFPADVQTPNASNLNWLAGQSPTPNKVDVKLSAAGEIKLYNHAGTVNVLADVVGYYSSKSLKELAATTGVPGPQGPIGPQGVAGWDTIPSGVTVTGAMVWDQGFDELGVDYRVYVKFPAKAPSAISSSQVNFSVDSSAATIDDDAACTGSPAAPTAPSGIVCLYLQSSLRVDSLDGQHNFFFNSDGFFVDFDSAGGVGDMYVYFSWAYTAP